MTEHIVFIFFPRRVFFCFLSSLLKAPVLNCEPSGSQLTSIKSISSDGWLVWSLSSPPSCLLVATFFIGLNCTTATICAQEMGGTFCLLFVLLAPHSGRLLTSSQTGTTDLHLDPPTTTGRQQIFILITSRRHNIPLWCCLQDYCWFRIRIRAGPLCTTSASLWRLVQITVESTCSVTNRCNLVSWLESIFSQQLLRNWKRTKEQRGQRGGRGYEAPCVWWCCCKSRVRRELSLKGSHSNANLPVYEKVSFFFCTQPELLKYCWKYIIAYI